MKQSLIRVWQSFDIEQIKKQLLLAGELTANCENCQHLGIDFVKEVKCPNCETYFKYIGFRTKNNKAEELFAIKRLAEKRPDLMIIDYEDIKRACGKSQARNLLDI
ncbi:MAG: hypothetical protein KJ915_06290 [Candidatus Omnitrophica bacterium]|nr:hypothetical protein [Candidatus Omnitrophota bacterium]